MKEKEGKQYIKRIKKKEKTERMKEKINSVCLFNDIANISDYPASNDGLGDNELKNM
jgi:hypothetical protein